MANIPMPRRIPRSDGPINKTYKLKDFIDKDEKYIKNSCTGSVLVDHETLVSNLDLLRKIISIKGNVQINCVDYESALYIEENIDEAVTISLLDDYQNKDRSYIDTTQFKKHKFYIPLSYCMWNPVFGDTCNVHCFRFTDYDTMVSVNGDKVLHKETLEKVSEIIGKINYGNLSDLDKCTLVSNYIQSRVQFVEGMESYADKVYIVDANEEDVTLEKVSSVDTVLNHNYGLCVAISNVTTLLLNNPTFNVNVRSMFGSSHAWNLATIEGEKRYIDNTWVITRNKNRVEGALRATSFSDDYMLFGSTTASQIGHHNSICYVDGSVEEEDYSKERLVESRKVLSKKISFSNYSKDLAFNSRVKKD